MQLHIYYTENDNMATTTIRIDVETREELKHLGNIGDDYDTVIKKLIEQYNRENLVRYSRKVVEERKGDFVDIDEL